MPIDTESKSMDYSKVILVEQHFHSNGRDSYWNTKFTIIERIEKNMNLKSISKNKKIDAFICGAIWI